MYVTKGGRCETRLQKHREQDMRFQIKINRKYGMEYVSKKKTGKLLCSAA